MRDERIDRMEEGRGRRYWYSTVHMREEGLERRKNGTVKGMRNEGICRRDEE